MCTVAHAAHETTTFFVQLPLLLALERGKTAHSRGMRHAPASIRTWFTRYDTGEEVKRETTLLRKLHDAAVPVVDVRAVLFDPPCIYSERVPLVLAQLHPSLINSREACRLIESAVHALHAAGYVHTDIAPRHIGVRPSRMVDSRVEMRSVVLLDVSGIGPLHTTVETPLGTSGFAAPALQRRGTCRLSPEIDLAAVGAVGHYMLSGRAPWRADDDLCIESRFLATAVQYGVACAYAYGMAYNVEEKLARTVMCLLAQAYKVETAEHASDDSVATEREISDMLRNEQWVDNVFKRIGW
jgi:serine/threonine protein kinase